MQMCTKWNERIRRKRKRQRKESEREGEKDRERERVVLSVLEKTFKIIIFVVECIFFF